MAAGIMLTYGHASIVLLKGQSSILQELNITANTTSIKEAILQGTTLSINEYISLFTDALKRVDIFRQITQIILEHIYIVFIIIIIIIILIIILLFYYFEVYRKPDRYVRIK